MNGELEESQIQRIHQIKQKYYKSLLMDGVIPLRKGVIRLLSEIKSYGLKQIIVTSSSREALEPLLENLFKDHLESWPVYITKKPSKSFYNNLFYRFC